jgi:hypothetical protein
MVAIDDGDGDGVSRQDARDVVGAAFPHKEGLGSALNAYPAISEAAFMRTY